MNSSTWKKDIEECVQILRTGGVILYPTDTIWGLGCDAKNFDSVNRIFQIKNRPQEKSMIVLVDSIEMLKTITENVSKEILEIIENEIQPLTVVYPSSKNVAQNVASENGSVAVRVTRDPFCKDLINRFGGPIVSTSANLSGNPHPGNFKEIAPEILSAADYVVEYKRAENTSNPPSRIISIDLSGKISVIRN